MFFFDLPVWAGGSLLKALIRILVLITGIIFIVFSFNSFKQKEDEIIEHEREIVESRKLEIEEEMKEKNEKRPETGVSTFIGGSVQSFKEKYGEPSRVEPSYYGYMWYIYNEGETYMLAGVLRDRVVTVAVASKDIDTNPFQIGENLESVYRKVSMQSEVVLKNDHGIYRFELFEDDLNTKPLITLGDLYVQLYFDRFTGEIMFIRFLDGYTLIKHRPYDMTYRGDLIESEPLTDDEYKLADKAAERQIFELTNIVRKKYNLAPLVWDEDLSKIAYHYSLEMHDNENTTEKDRPDEDLAGRLDKNNVLYEYAGENVAYHYTDSIAAVSGWLNSKKHRETMLNEHFTHMGTGVYKKFYTENFVERPR